MAQVKVPERYVLMGEVVRRSGLSRRTIYRRMDAGRFPASRQLSAGLIGWAVEDFEAWLDAPEQWRAPQ